MYKSDLDPASTPFNSLIYAACNGIFNSIRYSFIDTLSTNNTFTGKFACAKYLIDHGAIRDTLFSSICSILNRFCFF